MKINRDNLIELDNEVKMIPITYDFMFKSVFGRNLELLKEFLVDVLHLEYELEELDIRILNNELPKENVGEYQKRIDVNIVLNDDIYVEIEINREDFNLVKYRNKMYEDKLYSLVLESGENARKLEKILFFQLNLNTENKSEIVGERVVVPYDITNNEVYIENRKTILKYLEFYYRIYYNEPKKRTRDVIWLAALSSKSFIELYDILKDVLDDRLLKKFIRDVIDMSLEDFNLHEWQREKLDDMVAYNKEQQTLRRMEEAVEKALEEGLEQGIEQGISENTINLTKEMIRNGATTEFISKVTKLSNEEIKEIEESIKD